MPAEIVPQRLHGLEFLFDGHFVDRERGNHEGILAILRRLAIHSSLQGIILFWVGGIQGTNSSLVLSWGQNPTEVGTLNAAGLHFVAISQRLIHRNFIHVFQIASHGHSHRQTCNA